MTLPVLNMLSPLVNNSGLIMKPWNAFFQQFTQAPSPPITIIASGSPFFYTFKEPGQLSITGGAVTFISLNRGTLSLDVTGDKLIYGGIKDVVGIAYTSPPSIIFLPQF